MNLSYEENPKEILEELLKYHDVKTLRAILTNKIRRVTPKNKRDYFTIAVDVYLTQYRESSSLAWATEKVAEDRSTESNNYTVSTINKHITKFRKKIKDEMEKLNLNNKSKNDVNDFIYNYIKSVHYRMEEHHNHDYHYMESIDREYSYALSAYISEIEKDNRMAEEAQQRLEAQPRQKEFIDINEDEIPF